MSDMPSFPQNQPTPPPGPPAPAPRRGVPVAVVAGVLGLIIGALGVGLPWLLSGGGGGGAVALGGSSGSITAPATLGSFGSFRDANVRAGGARGAANAAQAASDDAQSAKLLSTAYGGAAATVTRYADNQLTDIIVLLAVRAQSPQPFVPYENLKELGESVPQQEVQNVGDVACVVVNSEPVVSGPEPTDGVVTSMCQRSGPGLTVQIRVTGDIQHHPGQVAALVDTAWAALG